MVSTRLRPPMQAIAHSVLLALALAGLAAPVRPDAATASWHPLLTTLWLLTAMIGLPFVALAATTPLLQSWHSSAGTREQASPAWGLYALSNLGSMLALVLYPWLIEPYFSLHAQRAAWGAGFAVFAAACASLAWRNVRRASVGRQSSGTDRESPAAEAAEAPLRSDALAAWMKSRSATKPGSRDSHPLRLEPASLQRRLLWVLLPAASSMLLCAITSHLSQNIAAIPLLWIVPLAAYLLSFIVTFAGARWYPRWVAMGALAFCLAIAGYLVGEQISVPLLLSIPTYVGSLFVFCFFCHGELYRLRPANDRATQFYLLMSLGSALGAIWIG